MKLINSKGRVLFEVLEATAHGLDAKGFIGLQYRYRGDGCGGYADNIGLQRTMDAIKRDSPSAKVVGLLPEPRIVPHFTFANHGSICVLTPMSAAAREWCDEHLPEDAQRWAGGYVIEPRYVEDIIAGLQGDGLTI